MSDDDDFLAAYRTPPRGAPSPYDPDGYPGYADVSRPAADTPGPGADVPRPGADVPRTGADLPPRGAGQAVTGPPAQPLSRRALRNSGQLPTADWGSSGGIPVPGGTVSGGIPVHGGAGGGSAPVGPSTGSIPLGPTSGPTSGPIRVERLQADRLVSDRPRVDPSERDLPESFPEAVRIAAQGSGVSLSGDRPATRHRNRKGVGPGGKPPRADRVLLMYLSAVLLIVVALGAGGAWLVLGPLHKDSATSGSATADRTLLVGLADGPKLVASALIGTGGGGSSCVLVPPSLVVTHGGRQVPLSETVAEGPGGAASALAATLNVKVDGAWLISVRGLTSLVDGGGGVVVDVDQEIRSENGTVLVGAGAGQRLTGAQATAFVTVKRDGDDVQALQQRFATVLGQVLAGLPAGATDAAKDLATVGAGTTSSLSQPELADVLTRVGQAVSGAGQLAVAKLPVVAAGADHPGGVVADKAVAGSLIRQKLGAAAGRSGS